MVGRKLRGYLFGSLIFIERHLRLGEKKWFDKKSELNFSKIYCERLPQPK